LVSARKSESPERGKSAKDMAQSIGMNGFRLRHRAETVMLWRALWCGLMGVDPSAVLARNPELPERPSAMRRAALCLLSSIALAAAVPALAQETAPATDRSAPAADPAALTPKTRAEGDANVAPAPVSEAAPAAEAPA